MSHPDLSAPRDLRPIEPGEIFENQVTRERAVIIELQWQNTDGRVPAGSQLSLARRVAGE